MQSAQDGSVLLTFNAGSSSIKLGMCAFSRGAPLPIGGDMVDLRHQPLLLHMVVDVTATEVPLQATVSVDMRAAGIDRPDLMIVDVHLPSSSGTGAVSEICATGFVPLVFVTGDMAEVNGQCPARWRSRSHSRKPISRARWQKRWRRREHRMR